MDTLTFDTPTHLTTIEQATNATAEVAYEAARTNGWHKDRPNRDDYRTDAAYIAADMHWLNTKLGLISSEAVEAQEELRKDGDAAHRYYLDTKTGEIHPEQVTIDGVPQYKPEGVASELADVIIRAGDTAGLAEINLGAAVVEKLAYNATRGQRHGGKKF